jgi:hypothetical protein
MTNQDQSILRALICAMESDIADPSRAQREIAALVKISQDALAKIAAIEKRQADLPRLLAKAKADLKHRTVPDLQKTLLEVQRLREMLANAPQNQKV